MKITFAVATCLFVLVSMYSCKKKQQFNTPLIKVNEHPIVRIDEPVCGPSRGKIINGDIYTSVDEPPEFPGGMKNFYAFVDKKLKYPAEAGGIIGRVI